MPTPLAGLTWGTCLLVLQPCQKGADRGDGVRGLCDHLWFPTTLNGTEQAPAPNLHTHKAHPTPLPLVLPAATVPTHLVSPTFPCLAILPAFQASRPLPRQLPLACNV